MPSTVNGIGTNYVGKKNLETRAATCQFCGNAVQLESFDTRLWFVFFFIPIIPLGRKHISESCPVCRRHLVADADQWETAKQLEISGAMDKYRTSPTPETAMEAHQQLLNFQAHAQANEFRQLIRKKHADSAKLHAYLGLALTHLGQLDEATTCFERALELRPDMPEARSGVAMDRIRHQRLDEARKLLDHLEKPGAEQLYPMGPLEMLGRAYQTAGRHTEALEVLGVLLKAFPDVGENKHFRDFIKTSEKALGKKESLLPKKKFSWKRIFSRSEPAHQQLPQERLTWRGLAVVGVFAGVILVALIVTNEYIRRHRTVHVVNAYSEPVMVKIDGGNVTRIPMGIHEIVVSEGKHRVEFTGPVRQEADFTVQAGYFDRWFGNPVWVLNPGGNALLIYETAIYSANPRPGSASFHFGEPFHFFPEVTHAFTALPQQVQANSSTEERTLTHLEVFRGEPRMLFHHLLENEGGDRALQLAEARLRVQPDAPELMAEYVAAALEQKKGARVEGFLRTGLTNRPVMIEWHRAYQELPGGESRSRSLIAEYDGYLQKDPRNSALLYLRGRLATDRAEGLKWFNDAREANPRNPYPYLALGYERANAGDFVEAADLFSEAVKLRPRDEGLVRMHWLTRVGAGDFDALEKEARAEMMTNPIDVYGIIRLSDLLLMQGKDAAAEGIIAGFKVNASVKLKEKSTGLIQVVHQNWLYSKGDFAELERYIARDTSPTAEFYRVAALLEQGRVDEALAIRPLSKLNNPDPFNYLEVALALRYAGHPAHEAWEARAVELLERGSHNEIPVAGMLRMTSPPSKSSVDAISLAFNEKAVLLAMLALKHPGERSQYAAAAQRYNLQRNFPFHLIARIASGAKP